MRVTVRGSRRAIRTYARASARMLLLAAGVVLAMASVLLPVAAAAPYPTQPIRIVCVHAPGGAGDLVARILADQLQKKLGQPVIVDNRPGASTIIAADLVAHAPPDGYTLLLATVTTLSINPAVRNDLPYKPKDFAPVSEVASTPFFVAINNAVPADSLSSLVALVKAKPNALNYGSSGTGGSSHLAGALFNLMAGTEMTHVPYKATSTRNADLVSGTIQVVFGNDVMPLAKAGKVKVLAVTSVQRLADYPNVPTVSEAAHLPGYEASVWYGLLAPAGTPAPIVDALYQATHEATTDPQVRAKLISVIGGEAVGSTPAEFSKTIETDYAKWKDVIQRAHIDATE